MNFDQSQPYDIAIVGAGLSGWLLLEALSRYETFSKVNVLLISSAKEESRSWCFWDGALEAPFREMVDTSWPKLAFLSTGFQTSQSPGKFQYHYIPGKRFFSFFKEEFLPRHPNIRLHVDEINSISGQKGDFLVKGTKETYRARQVYNSALIGARPKVETWQHFFGWFIETKTPVFKTDEAILMDFSVPQENGCSFMYVLPLSENRALVELTFFSNKILEAHVYEDALARYIQTRYDAEYTVIEKEQGQIPMQQGVFTSYGAHGETNLGTLAGMVKASTGYAFQRIRNDSKALAQAYFSHSPANRISEKGRFALYDALLLWIIRHHPEWCRPIFTRLFMRRRIELILRFMDQRTNVWEELGIFVRLPVFIFLKALYYHVFSMKKQKQGAAKPVQKVPQRA